MTRRQRSSGWFRASVQVAGIAWAAPQVVAYRMARMAAGDGRETRLMLREKVEAAVEVAGVMMSPRGRSAAAVLEPVHRRVMANRRRLARG